MNTFLLSRNAKTRELDLINAGTITLRIIHYYITFYVSTSQQYITITPDDTTNKMNVTWTRMSGIKWMDGSNKKTLLIYSS